MISLQGSTKQPPMQWGFTLFLSVNDYIYHIDGHHKKYYKYAKHLNQVVNDNSNDIDSNDVTNTNLNVNFLEEYFVNPIKTLFNYIASKSASITNSTSFSKFLLYEGNFQDINKIPDTLNQDYSQIVASNGNENLSFYRKIIDKLNFVATPSRTKKIDKDHQIFRQCLKHVLSTLQTLCDTDILNPSQFQWKLIINSSDVINDLDGSFVLESNSTSILVTSMKYDAVTAFSVYSLSSSVKYFTININLPFVTVNGQSELIMKFKHLLIKIIIMLLDHE